MIPPKSIEHASKDAQRTKQKEKKAEWLHFAQLVILSSSVQLGLIGCSSTEAPSGNSIYPYPYPWNGASKVAQSSNYYHLTLKPRHKQTAAGNKSRKQNGQTIKVRQRLKV